MSKKKQRVEQVFMVRQADGPPVEPTGFAVIPRAVALSPRLSFASKGIYAYMIGSADVTGYHDGVFPVAADDLFHDKRMDRAIEALVKAGLIEREGEGFRVHLGLS